MSCMCGNQEKESLCYYDYSFTVEQSRPKAYSLSIIPSEAANLVALLVVNAVCLLKHMDMISHA
jgi:hypothetical protein